MTSLFLPAISWFESNAVWISTSLKIWRSVGLFARLEKSSLLAVDNNKGTDSLVDTPADVAWYLAAFT